MTPPDGLTASTAERDQAFSAPPVPASHTATLSVSGTKFLAVLGSVMVFLWATSLSLPLIFQAAGRFNWETYRLLDVRHEGNLPTLFATVQLFVAAGVCVLIGRLEARGQRAHWMGLGVIFVFLGIDETAQLHELLAFVKISISNSVMPEWIWALFYGPAVLLIGGLYVPFLRRLPTATAVTFVTGGVLFLLGSLGLEMLGTYQAKLLALPRNHAHFTLQVHVEELCELTGIFVFVWGAVRFLERRWSRIHFLTQ
jgi:hypothetical protein